MTDTDSWQGYIRMLIYPIQFTKIPTSRIADVLEMVEQSSSRGLTAEKYLWAIETAFASSEHLADLIPQRHPEAVIHEYLKVLGEKLREKLGEA